MTLHPDVLGIDISKHHLDIFDPLGTTPARLANGVAAAERLASSLAQRDCLVVLEATGHYDLCLRRALAAAGVRYARVNPQQARDFARATRRQAKTDAIDARMLAELGQRLSLRCETPLDPERQQLASRSRRRDQLVSIRQAERTRRSECDDPEITASLDEHLAWLDTAIARLERSIHSLIETSPALQRDEALLRSVPGVGPVTATVLLANLPELGHRSPKTIAALAGLAPYNNDSGKFVGKRSVRGGRKRVRDALYMAAVAAARSNTTLASFQHSLRATGKPPKLALIALARKMIVVLNAVLRDQAPFASA